jgi:imidazoleglycerol-phosphate dehydratase
MKRKARIHRKTSETDIAIALALEGTGTARVNTTIPFLDHMLTLFAKHGRFDLDVQASGDTEVDDHHLVEDVGICLGDALKEALGGKQGINRYGIALTPMDETLCSVALDLSGRPYLVYHVKFGSRKIKQFDAALLHEFFKALTDRSGMTLHINLVYGKNTHHIAEGTFKAFARALMEAVAIPEGRTDLPSTKGLL